MVSGPITLPTSMFVNHAPDIAYLRSAVGSLVEREEKMVDSLEAMMIGLKARDIRVTELEAKAATHQSELSAIRGEMRGFKEGNAGICVALHRVLDSLKLGEEVTLGLRDVVDALHDRLGVLEGAQVTRDVEEAAAVRVKRKREEEVPELESDSEPEAEDSSSSSSSEPTLTPAPPRRKRIPRAAKRVKR